jgi:hypothetical protein
VEGGPAAPPTPPSRSPRPGCGPRTRCWSWPASVCWSACASRRR